MLVLSRKIGEGVRLGDDIRITIVKGDRNSVRIGIEAPNGISIRREEIFTTSEDSPSESRHAGVNVA